MGVEERGSHRHRPDGHSQRGARARARAEQNRRAKNRRFAVCKVDLPRVWMAEGEWSDSDADREDSGRFADESVFGSEYAGRTAICRRENYETGRPDSNGP